MTLDEAIAKYKEITNTDAICPAHCNIPYDKCLQESERIAEWLEELKELREKNETLKALYEDVRKEGNNLLKRERNKAIDEWVESDCPRDCPYFMDGNECNADKCIIDLVNERSVKQNEQGI